MRSDRRTGRDEGVEHLLGARPERELRRRVQQLHAGFLLECAPPLLGPLRHCDEPRVGVAQSEDTRRTVGTAARISDGVALEHQHLAPAAQRPRGRQAEEPAADDDDVTS